MIAACSTTHNGPLQLGIRRVWFFVSFTYSVEVVEIVAGLDVSNGVVDGYVLLEM